jgi:hypothetical protein
MTIHRSTGYMSVVTQIDRLHECGDTDYCVTIKDFPISKDETQTTTFENRDEHSLLGRISSELPSPRNASKVRILTEDNDF